MENVASAGCFASRSWIARMLVSRRRKYSTMRCLMLLGVFNWRVSRSVLCSSVDSVLLSLEICCSSIGFDEIRISCSW